MDDETVKTTINSTELKNDSTNEDVSLHTDSSTTSSSSPSINSFRIQIVEPQTEHNNSKESSNKAKISNPSNLANNVGTNPSQVPEILTTSPPGESTPQGHNNFSSQDINMLTPNSNRTTVSGSPTLSPSNYNSDSSNLASPTTPLSTQKGSPPAGLFNSFSVNPQGKTTTGQPQSPSPVKAKPYVCTECNQTFSRQHNLKSHALTHSQEKPFQCEVCQHFFRRHHDLKRHAKLHTGEKPYQCPHCKRSFARLDALNRHLRAESFCGAPQKKLYQTSTNGQQQPSQQQTEQKVEQPQQIQSQPQQQQPLPPPQQKQHKQQIDKNVESQVNKSPTLQSESQRQSQENFQQVQQEQYKQWQQHQQIQMQKVPSNLSNSNRIGQIVFPVESVAKTSPTNIQRYSIQYAQDPQQRIVDDPLKIDPDVDTIIINRRTSAMSQLEIQLKERNDYLEDRVRQLENEVINERKLRNRRELLEEQVRKLEIEKNLLKSLLLERSNRGPADIVPAGSGGGYDIELTKRSEKKRKASYLGELSSSPKHQKDYDGATVIPQSAQ